jgi:hypothetical protein
MIFDTRRQAIAIAAANQRDENEAAIEGHVPWTYTARQVPRGYVVDVANETGIVEGQL